MNCLYRQFGKFQKTAFSPTNLTVIVAFRDYSAVYSCDVPLLLFFYRQGVTLTDLKEAERTVNRMSEPVSQFSLQSVGAVVTVTPAERGK